MHEHEIYQEPDKKGPIKIIMGLMLLFILILSIVPLYGIKQDPEPKTIAKIPYNPKEIPNKLNSIYQFSELEVTQPIRDYAIRITQNSCEKNNLCNLKSLYYYVKNNINYLSDPKKEYIQHPEETLIGAGDCEDQAILLAMLAKSIGIEARIAIIPGHAYTQVYYPEAPRKYKGKDGWISLDPTCEPCIFGEAPKKEEIIMTISNKI